MRKILLSLIAIAALTLAVLVGFSQRPGTVGLVDGALRACESGACVNSQLGPPEHRVEPLFVASVGPQDPPEAAPAAVAEAWRGLQYLLAQDSQGRINHVEGPWMAAQWRAPVLFFTDDVEFLRLDGAGVIHVRAASRLGPFGMGTHRAAVETLRERLAETLQAGLPSPETP